MQNTYLWAHETGRPVSPKSRSIYDERDSLHLHKCWQTYYGSSTRIISCIASDSIRVESLVSTCSWLPFTVVGVFIWGSGVLFCCNNPRISDFPFRDTEEKQIQQTASNSEPHCAGVWLGKENYNQTPWNISRQDNFLIEQFMTITESESPLKLCFLFFMHSPEKVSHTSSPLYFVCFCLALHFDTWHHFGPNTVAPPTSEPGSINITQLI